MLTLIKNINMKEPNGTLHNNNDNLIFVQPHFIFPNKYHEEPHLLPLVLAPRVPQSEFLKAAAYFRAVDQTNKIFK
jgi:hypothetical protein